MGEQPLGQGPVGDSTRLAIGVAGLYERERANRRAAVIAVAVAGLLGLLALLDLTGVLVIPGMGAVYDAAGIEDPNAGREVARVEQKLGAVDLDAEERAALVARLLAAQQRAAAEGESAAEGEEAVPTEGVVDTADLPAAERALVQDVFADQQKKEAALTLAPSEEAPAPNMPDGLSQEVIAKVIADNSSSMSLCVAEAARKGETLTGRMEMSLTVAADGRVIETRVETPRFAGSVVGACAGRRIRNWQFPRFNGEPVTVVFPYVLQ